VPHEDLYWTILFLRKRGFSEAELAYLIQYNSDILTINHKTLELNLKFFFRLKIRGKDLNDLVLRHPEFLLMAPGEMLHKKIKILSEFGIDIDQQASIIRDYPSIYLKSVGSLTLKLKYL